MFTLTFFVFFSQNSCFDKARCCYQDWRCHRLDLLVQPNSDQSKNDQADMVRSSSCTIQSDDHVVVIHQTSSCQAVFYINSWRTRFFQVTTYGMPRDKTFSIYLTFYFVLSHNTIISLPSVSQIWL